MADQEKIHRRRFLRRAMIGTAGLMSTMTMGSQPLSDSENRPDNQRIKQDKESTPRASLMLIGGSYPVLDMDEIEKRLPNGITPDECDPYGHYRQMLELCPNKPPVVEFITCASRRYAQDNARQYEKLFTFLGAGKVGSISTHDHGLLKSDPSMAERLRRADLIYVTGGDQTLLADLFKNTDAYNVLRERYANDPNLVIAGTSAGSMIMARNMIDGNPEKPGEPTPMNTGFAFLPAAIETHMDGRKREPRLLSALEQSPGSIGIGLDNATALIVKNGQATVKGPGRVLVTCHSQDDLKQQQERSIDLASIGCRDYKTKGMSAHIYRMGDIFELGEFAQLPSATQHLSRPPRTQGIALQ